MTLDLLIEDARWESVDLAALATRAHDALCAQLGLDAAMCEASILACDDAKIRTLNGDFRDKDAATNVLSWPAEERATPGAVPPLPRADVFGTIELGDIAVAYDTFAREAEAAGKPMAEHVTHLLVHGLLHLLGYDHITDEDAAIMERTEAEILATLGIDNPYEI